MKNSLSCIFIFIILFSILGCICLEGKPVYCCYSDNPKPLKLYLRLDTGLIPQSGIFVMGAVGTEMFFAEFCLHWITIGGMGDERIDVRVEGSPIEVQIGKIIAKNRPVDDRYLFMTTKPGDYLFRARTVDADGNEASDTLLVKVPE